MFNKTYIYFVADYFIFNITEACLTLKSLSTSGTLPYKYRHLDVLIKQMGGRITRPVTDEKKI